MEAPSRSEAARYRIEIRRSGKTLKSLRFLVEASASPATPSPTVGCNPTGFESVSIGEPLVAAQAEFGVFLSFPVVNNGSACLMTPKNSRIQHLIGESWADVTAPPNPETSDLSFFRPGDTSAAGARLASDAPAGTYRVRVPLARYPGNPLTATYTDHYREFSYAGRPA